MKSSSAPRIPLRHGITLEGVDVARRIAQMAVERGLPVVSGGARGVDQQAMTAAYQAGGKVIGVLAESLARRVRDPDTRGVIGEGAGPGNAALLDLGAVAVTTLQDPSWLDQPATVSRGPEQLRFG